MLFAWVFACCVESLYWSKLSWFWAVNYYCYNCSYCEAAAAASIWAWERCDSCLVDILEDTLAEADLLGLNFLPYAASRSCSFARFGSGL